MLVRSLAITLAVAVSPVWSAAAERPDSRPQYPDPFELYGPDIAFDVYRKGDKVGFHEVRFEQAGDSLRVVNTFQLEIEVLFFTAFRYRYHSDSRWRDGRLLQLTATVNDNGTKSVIQAARDGAGMAIRTGEDRTAVDSILFPTNHWNVAVLNQTRVLNTLTGRVNAVNIERRGREEIATERGPVMATRYAYTGEIDAEVWYDDQGRWVKLRFRGQDGSTVEYACRRCQGHVGAHAANG
ncbi:MAG: hypothetical protein JSU82_04760 [Rhodospirillales bacterium]|nr:MAG: hypothetical protein JSU82_04760 [Rhodospirillales bacterium]